MTLLQFKIALILVFITVMVYVAYFFYSLKKEQNTYVSKKKNLLKKIQEEKRKNTELTYRIEISDDLHFSMQNSVFTINKDLLQLLKNKY